MTMSIVAQSLQVINARVTYRNAPIHLLERFTFKDLDRSYKAFLEKTGLKECIIIQTCNRVEVFAASENLDERKLLEEWGSTVGLSNKSLQILLRLIKVKMSYCIC